MVGEGGKGRKAVRTPHPLPHHFLFHPWFSFRVAESLNTLRTTPKKPASYAGYPENFSDELNMSGNEHRDVPFKFRALPPTPPQIPPPPPNPPTPPPMDEQILTTSPFLIWTL